MIVMQLLYNAETIANLLGLGVRRVEQLAKEEVLPAAKKRPYMFEPAPTIQAYIKYCSGKVSRGESNDLTADLELQKLQAETDLKRSKADMSALQLNELEGKMHCSEDVEAMTTDLVFAVRSMIMALPGRLAVDVAGVETAAEASVIIRSECYKILENLSEYKYDSEAYRRQVREREGWSETPIDESDD